MRLFEKRNVLLIVSETPSGIETNAEMNVIQNLNAPTKALLGSFLDEVKKVMK